MEEGKKGKRRGACGAVVEPHDASKAGESLLLLDRVVVQIVGAPYLSHPFLKVHQHDEPI